MKEHFDYMRNILKKFMFQVHPDYFYNAKQLQSINNQNLRLLQELFHEKNDSSNLNLPQMKVDTRTLTFYVKPNDLWTEPKKVKVATNRIVESMIEILETIGVEIPEKPEEFEYFQSLLLQQQRSQSSGVVWTSYAHDVRKNPTESEGGLDSETLRILQFLDSIADRKELIALREDRTKILLQTEEDLLALTKLTKIEYWNSWSAHNNRLLLSNILQYIQEHQKELQLPWTGLSLLMAKDDAASLDVDYIERLIRIDCSDIAAQWIYAFQKISQENLQTMREIEVKIDTLQHEIEQIFRYWVEERKHQARLNQEPIDFPSNVVIDIRKGFTCTRRRYAEWLGKIQQELLSLADANISPSLSPLSSSSTSIWQHDSPEMEIAPVPLTFIIEDSHGTKLLPNGSFQIDVITPAAQLKEYITSKLPLAIEKIKHQQLIEEKVTSLQSQLIHRLELTSITRGKGIQEDQYLFALNNLSSYLRRKNPIESKKSWNRGVLKHLSGIRIIIGHYHGIRDDGACLLPWNFKILEVL